MLVTVKALQGRECSLEERVGVLKQLVATRLDVPVEQQRLLFRGKALADDRSLSDYSIGPSARLNLVLKPPRGGGVPGVGTTTSTPTSEEFGDPLPALFLGGALTGVLERHFGASDVPRILQQLQKDYEQSLRGLSLDDVERLGSRLLQPEGTPTPDPHPPPRDPPPEIN